MGDAFDEVGEGLSGGEGDEAAHSDVGPCGMDDAAVMSDGGGGECRIRCGSWIGWSGICSLEDVWARGSWREFRSLFNGVIIFGRLFVVGGV